jgi:PAS domain S-box-containing protein
MDATISSSPNLSDRIASLRKIIPISFSIVAIIYQVGPARWVHDLFGEDVHYLVEIAFFATAGPLLAFWTLSVIRGWLMQKEQAEDQVRMSERRLASITSASADAILGLSPSGHVESWNKGAEFLFGYKDDEFVGRPFVDLFTDESSAEVELRWLGDTVRMGGFVREHEMSCQDSIGRIKTVELTATNLTDLDGAPMGTSVIMRDVTSRKKREQEIQRLNASLNLTVAERTAELADKVGQLALANEELLNLDLMRTEFVSLVSHQIRAPLTNMRGAVDRMQASCGDINPTCERMFTILESQVARLDRLVRQILNTARIEAKELITRREPLSIMPFINEVLEENRVRFLDREIRLPTKPGLPLVNADRSHLTEVLVNLLDNAEKYSPRGSEIQIDIRADQTKLELSIRDHGPGFPGKDLERIFEKFYRADSSDSQPVYGYGLGLYLCRSLINAQDGQIWAENHAEGGAVFTVSLPVWQGDYA